MRQPISTMIRSIWNKGGAAVPAMAPPAALPPPPTMENSEEVKKQKQIEAERQKRAGGLGATDNTGGTGVPLDQENIDKTKLDKAKTLLGQ